MPPAMKYVGFAAVLALSAASVAWAEDSYLPTGLSGADMAVMEDAAKHISHAPSAAGRPEHWNNPQTGHSGTITFVRDLRKQKMPCRLFRYRFFTGGTNDGNPYALTWCVTPQNSWQIVN